MKMIKEDASRKNCQQLWNRGGFYKQIKVCSTWGPQLSRAPMSNTLNYPIAAWRAEHDCNCSKNNSRVEEMQKKMKGYLHPLSSDVSSVHIG